MTASVSRPVALCGGTVVANFDPLAVVSADVTIAGDRIASVGPAPDGAVRRDCSGSLVVPGNVCAHHHVYSALSRGMPYRLDPPANFLQILQRIWWRLDRALDESSIRASALLAGLEAVQVGTTTIVDHHASPSAIDGSLDLIATALSEVGVRSVLCYEVTDRDGPERANAGIVENRRFLRVAGGLARGMVGAHASFTIGDDTLEAIAGLAAESGAGVHIHVAEDAVDARVVERLHRAGVLDDRALLAHCVHVDDHEIELISASGATVVCNPRSNMNNRVGHSPFNHIGDRVALGTDGIGGDMFSESQAGFFRAKETDGATPETWPFQRLRHGARFAGRMFDEPALGTIGEGAPADVVVLDYPQPTPLDAENLSGHWLYGLSAARVRDVYVAGRLVVERGRSTLVDEAKVAAEAHAEAERLWARLDDIPAHPFGPEGSRR